MDRTTIILPTLLKLKLQQEAKKQNASFGEVVRQALEKYLFAKTNPASLDPFLSSTTIFSDPDQSDVAEHHDKYLYQGSPHGNESP